MGNGIGKPAPSSSTGAAKDMQTTKPASQLKKSKSISKPKPKSKSKSIDETSKAKKSVDKGLPATAPLAPAGKDVNKNDLSVGPQRPLRSNTKDAAPQKTILFYNKGEPYYSFTNFSPHPVKHEDAVYPTSEHLFQALKFLPHRPNLAHHIRSQPNPRQAFSEAQRFASERRKDWIDVSIKMMDLAIGLKFRQHDDIKKELLSTGDAYLIENAGVNDAFWGNGADGKGRNELGLALMRLRDALRKEAGPKL